MVDETKAFEEKNIHGQKPGIRPLTEEPSGNPKSNDPFAWDNYRTSDRRAIRLWGLLTDLADVLMEIPMSEYLEMEISDIVRKDLEKLPPIIVEWLSNEQ